MALQIPRPHQSSAGKQAQQAQPEAQQNELEILNPEREVTLGGKVYTIREYGHVEWLKLLRTVEPLVVAISEHLDKFSKLQNPPIDESLPFNEVLNVLGEHIEQLLPVVLQSCDMTLEEFNALNLFDVEAFLMYWWSVNSRFFFIRAKTRLEILRGEREIRQRVQQALAPSMPSSSAVGTD